MANNEKNPQPVGVEANTMNIATMNLRNRRARRLRGAWTIRLIRLGVHFGHWLSDGTRQEARR